MGVYGSPQLGPFSDNPKHYITCPKCGNITYDTYKRCPKCGKNLKKHTKAIVIVCAVLIAIVIIKFNNISNTNHTNAPQSQETTDYIQQPVIPPIAAPISEAQYKQMCKSYDYTSLARNPNQYMYEKTKVTGYVIQAQETDNTVVILANVTKNEYGIWNNTMWIEYTRKANDELRILENDIIDAYGESRGIINYTSIMGKQMSVPAIKAEYIDIKTQ